jgi:voltage-gated potassium channel
MNVTRAKPNASERWPLFGRFLARLKHVLALLATIIAVGMVGFRFLLPKISSLTALYYTVSIMTTLGLPAEPADPRVKAFVILLALSGIGLFLYAITVTAQFLMEGEFEQGVRRGKVKRQMKQMQDHCIVCGYGRMGEMVSRQMREQGQPCVVIDHADAPFEQAEAAGLVAFKGDATQEEVLTTAGIERARALVAVASTDAENVLITMTARQLNPAMTIVARCASESNAERFRRAGASRVVTPYVNGAYQLALAATKPNVIDWFSLATGRGEHGFQIEELQMPERSTGVGQTLMELAPGSRFGVMVIGIKPADGGEMQLNPSAQTRLVAGDLLICVGQSEQLERLGQFLDKPPGARA